MAKCAPSSVNLQQHSGPVFFFGGTFDPPHRGHRNIVRRLLARDRISRVVVMPALGAPLRNNERLFSYRERFKLLRRIFETEIASGRVVLSALERRLPKPNYTINTLAVLEKICPQKPIVVVGADQAENLRAWYRSADLVAKYEFIIFARQGSRVDALSDLKAEYIADFHEDIAATNIRSALARIPQAERFAHAARYAEDTLT